jgi:hypothetical protein
MDRRTGRRTMALKEIKTEFSGWAGYRGVSVC